MSVSGIDAGNGVMVFSKRLLRAEPEALHIWPSLLAISQHIRPVCTLYNNFVDQTNIRFHQCHFCAELSGDLLRLKLYPSLRVNRKILFERKVV